MANMTSRLAVVNGAVVILIVASLAGCSDRNSGDNRNRSQDRNEVNIENGSVYLAPNSQDRKIGSPDGNYDLSLKIDDKSAEVSVQIAEVGSDPRLYGKSVSTADMYFAGWDSDNRAWLYSGDIGTQVFERSGDHWVAGWAADSGYKTPQWAV